jgi:hypothetical protein
MNLKFANFYKTTLSNPVSPGDFTVQVVSTIGAPTTGGGNYFYGVITDKSTGLIREIVKVTSLVGSTYTVTRAQGGTTAQSFSINDYFACGWTAESINDITDQFLLTTSSPTFNGITLTTASINTLTVTGTSYLGGNSGSESLNVPNVASAVNKIKVQGAVTTGVPSLSAYGSDTNVSMSLTTQGTGAFNFFTNSTVQQFQIANTASAVNYASITGSATASNTGPAISCLGTDTDINFSVFTKGAGAFKVYSYGGTNQTFSVNTVASSVNWLRVFPSSTGNPVILSPNGSDTNISTVIGSVQSGSINLNTGLLVGSFSGGGTTQAQVTHTASAVNYTSMTGGATGTGPTILGTGTDSNVDLRLSAKGTGNIRMLNNPRFDGTNSTGAGSAALGSNCPAGTLTAPYKWIQAVSADGSTVYIPAWK